MDNPHTRAPISSPGFDPKIEWNRARDGFAGRAMAALLSDTAAMQKAATANNVPFGEFVGQVAYEIADGMMKAKKQRPRNDNRNQN